MGPQLQYLDNVMTKVIINKRTDKKLKSSCFFYSKELKWSRGQGLDEEGIVV